MQKYMAAFVLLILVGMDAAEAQTRQKDNPPKLNIQRRSFLDFLVVQSERRQRSIAEAKLGVFLKKAATLSGKDELEATMLDGQLPSR